MSDIVTAAIIGGVASMVLFLLGRIFGGSKRDLLAQYDRWTASQETRIQGLESRVEALENELDAANKENQELEKTNRRQGTLLTATLRWALLMRDEVIRCDGTVPPAPPEVEAAMTTLIP